MKVLLIVLLSIFIISPAIAVRNDEITRSGDILQLVIPLSALLYSASIGDWQGVKQFGYVSGSTLGTTYALKYTVREERPYQAEGAKGHTFPSGHTSFAFAGAGYWQKRYGWQVGAPMYAAAAFVGYSRNHARMHNWLDIASGAAIGIGFNLLFTSRYGNDTAQVSAVPMYDGLMLRFDARF